MAKIDELLQATTEIQASVDAAVAKIDALKAGNDAQLQPAIDAINLAKSKLNAAIDP